MSSDNYGNTATKLEISYCQVGSKDDKETTTYEEELETIGIGKYNYRLLILCTAISTAASCELFSIGVVTTTAQCDLELDIAKRGFIGSVPMLGVVSSALLWGYIADTRGRKFTLIICISGCVGSALVSSFTTGWIFYTIFKFIAAMFAAGSLSTVYTFLGECTPVGHRTSYMLYCTTGAMFSQAVIAAMAYPVVEQNFSIYMAFLGFHYRPWRLLIQVLAAANGVCLLGLYLFTFESIKFHLAQGDHDTGMNILEKIYKINKGSKDNNFSHKQLILQEEANAEKEGNFIKQLWRQTAPLFYRKHIKNTLLMTYAMFVIFAVSPSFHLWFPEIFNRYALAKGSDMSFCEIFNIDMGKNATRGSSEAMNQTVKCYDGISYHSYFIMISSAFYLLAMSLISLTAAKYIGKKRTFIVFHILSAISAVLINRVPLSWSTVPFMGLLTSVVTMGIVTNYIVELYPTYLRGMAVSLILMFGRGSSFVITNVLSHQLFHNCNNLFIIIGVFLSSGVLVGLILPPTGPKIVQKTEEDNTTVTDKELA